jgi:hypothetical protein
MSLPPPSHPHIFALSSARHLSPAGFSSSLFLRSTLLGHRLFGLAVCASDSTVASCAACCQCQVQSISPSALLGMGLCLLLPSSAHLTTPLPFPSSKSQCQCRLVAVTTAKMRRKGEKPKGVGAACWHWHRQRGRGEEGKGQRCANARKEPIGQTSSTQPRGQPTGMGHGQTRTNGTSSGDWDLLGWCCCIISLFPQKAANGLKLAGREEGNKQQ